MIPHLTEVLTLTRPMIGIDLETTGVKAQTSGIVELALEIMAPQKPTKTYRTLVNPMMPIPPEATAIHGITNALVADAPTFAQLADNLLKGFDGCDFCGYSVRFDLEQLAEEFKRANKPWSYGGACIIDAFRVWQLAEGRTLSHAVDRWLKGSAQVSDIEIETELGDSGKAHNALWDIQMSTRVLAAQLVHCKKLPRDLKQLHELCWPGWFDPEGKLKWNESNELCFSFGEHRGKPIRLVPKGYLKWVSGKDFSELVKTTCSNAMRGVYPSPPSEPF